MSVWVSGDVTKPWEIHDCEHCKYWTGLLGDRHGKCKNEASEHLGDTMWYNELCDEFERYEDDDEA